MQRLLCLALCSACVAGPPPLVAVDVSRDTRDTTLSEVKLNAPIEGWYVFALADAEDGASFSELNVSRHLVSGVSLAVEADAIGGVEEPLTRAGITWLAQPWLLVKAQPIGDEQLAAVIYQEYEWRERRFALDSFFDLNPGGNVVGEVQARAHVGGALWLVARYRYDDYREGEEVGWSIGPMIALR